MISNRMRKNKRRKSNINATDPHSMKNVNLFGIEHVTYRVLGTYNV